MRFNIFKTSRRYNKIDYHDGMGIREVVHKLSYLGNLRNFVIKNFNNILKNSFPDEFRFFSMFEEWKRLFLENADVVFEQIEDKYEFESTIQIFPELAHDGYLYLLNAVLNNSKDYPSTLSLPHDILVPMSAIERISEYRFNIIREKVYEILDATLNYEDFYDTIYVLENYFNIPSEILKTAVEKLMEKEILLWISEDRDANDTDILVEFFYSEEAYNLFKDNLRKILHIHGISLYANLIKVVGPDPEIIEAQYCCPEYYLN